MPTTCYRLVEATAAADAEVVETYATSGSSKVSELREQLTLLTNLVER